MECQKTSRVCAWHVEPFYTWELEENYKGSPFNPIPISNGRMYRIENVKYCIVTFKVQSINKIDLIDTLTPPHEGSSLFISKIPEADSAKFIRSGPFIEIFSNTFYSFISTGTFGIV